MHDQDNTTAVQPAASVTGPVAKSDLSRIYYTVRNQRIIEEAKQYLASGKSLETYGFLAKLGKKYGSSKERIRQILLAHLPEYRKLIQARVECPVCGRKFQREVPGQKYCSKQCLRRVVVARAYPPLMSRKQLEKRTQQTMLKIRCKLMKPRDIQLLQTIRDTADMLLRIAAEQCS